MSKPSLNAAEGEFVSYYGRTNEWKVYRVSDGTLVGYKSPRDERGEITGTVVRVVTNARDIVEFSQYADKHEKKAPRYDPKKDPNQMRIE